MFLFVLSALALVPWNGALGGQIPIVGGLLGGVPTPSPPTANRPQSLQTTATTPGKLRVVENSGICGKFIYLLKALVGSLQYLCYFRDNPWGFSSLRLWRFDGHRKYLVRSQSTKNVHSDDITLKVLVLCSSKQPGYRTISSLVQWRSMFLP